MFLNVEVEPMGTEESNTEIQQGGAECGFNKRKRQVVTGGGSYRGRQAVGRDYVWRN